LRKKKTAEKDGKKVIFTEGIQGVRYCVWGQRGQSECHHMGLRKCPQSNKKSIRAQRAKKKKSGRHSREDEHIMKEKDLLARDIERKPSHN
jgi:hypothetical protein